jgi:uncharacterized protein
VLGVLAVVALGGRSVAHVYVDWLWFSELGQRQLFWTMAGSRWLMATLAGVGTTVLLLANVWIAERNAPRDPSRVRVRQLLLPAYLAVAGGAGVLVGQTVAATEWQRVVLWLHRRDFGVVDPLFQRDVGFFVFSLPLYERVALLAMLLVAAALVLSFVAHVATGAIRTSPPPISATRAAHAHVLALGAVLLALLAWRHWLAQYALELPADGETVIAGAGYTDVHVELPWLRVLVFVSLLGAAALVYAAARRSRALPAVVLAVVAVGELVNPSILPSVVQRIVVDPQTLSREHPYIADSLRLTRHAYDLEHVDDRALPADDSISTDDLLANRDVLRNVQLWDSDVLRREIDQQQSIAPYYGFPSVTFDRYRRGGAVEGLTLAQRELDLSRVEPSGRTWANDHLAYTHGYGLVAVPAGGIDEEGRPTFASSEFSAGSQSLRVRQPRLYYGTLPPGSQQWVVGNSNRAEVERSTPGAPNRRYHYGGQGGIPLRGPARRAMLALRFNDLNLLLSHTVGSESRLMIHRDVGERLRKLAPFLQWEPRPEVAVVDGRVLYLAHGYTTSDSFPYSVEAEIGDADVNYVRAAVVATVDAFTGQTALYATDPDPILRAWRSAFPGLFEPAARMPAGVREHLRYPQELFAAQSRIWSTFHVGDVERFYTRGDAWQPAADVAGPVDAVGTLRDRFRGDEEPRMRPAFQLLRLPGERDVELMLTLPYTPHSQENLSGLLAGSVDDLGRARLTQLTLPQSRLVLGPSQVSRQILATPALSDTLRLLNQETTDLGTRAVNTVELSSVRVVPIGDSFMFVQTVYVTARGTGVTRVRLVTVFLNGRVGYGRTLDAALQRAGAPL